MKLRRNIWILIPALIALIALNVVAEKKEAQAESKGEAIASKEAVENKATPIALTVEAIQELEQRKAELDARERELMERARALEMQEKILKEKIAKMEALRLKMSERLDKFKGEHESKVAKLVTMVETMRPQAAAEYVENLDPDLAVEILGRIQVVRAAKIMNLVDKKKGARLSELYTGYLENLTNDTKTKQEKEVPAKTQM